jgi:hypothetical protein
VQDFFSGIRPRGCALPSINVSQLVSSPSIITPTAVEAALEMLKADASAARGAFAAGVGGGALGAAERAAAHARGPAAAGEAFGALASSAAMPWGGALSPGTPAADGSAPAGGAAPQPRWRGAAGQDAYSPSPPHVGAFVVPPSPLVGFQSSQLPVRAQPQSARGMPTISEAHPAAAHPAAAHPAAAHPAAAHPAAAQRGAAAATAAALAVAPGAAGGALDVGGAGASALGGGLQRGLGAPLIPTLSSAVDDEALMAALELLAPQASGGGAADGARDARSRSDTGEGGARAGGGAEERAGADAPAPPPGLVRSLSDVQIADAAPGEAGPQEVRVSGGMAP